MLILHVSDKGDRDLLKGGAGVGRSFLVDGPLRVELKPRELDWVDGGEGELGVAGSHAQPIFYLCFC